MFTDFNSGALNMPMAYLVTNLTLTKSVGPMTHLLVYITEDYNGKKLRISNFAFAKVKVKTLNRVEN